MAHLENVALLAFQLHPHPFEVFEPVVLDIAVRTEVSQPNKAFTLAYPQLVAR